MIAALAAAGAVVVTALVSYFVARLKASGRIGTTEAGKLWDEAASLRKAYKEQADACLAEMKLVRGEVDVLRQSLKAANIEIDRLKERIAEQLASNERSNVATAESLARIEQGAADVASDLADSHQRADDATGDPGAAADEFSRTKPAEEQP